MHSFKTFAFLALAAAVVAAPTPTEQSAALEPRQWRGGNRWWSRPAPDAETETNGYDSVPVESVAPAAPAATTEAVTVPASPPTGQSWGSPSSAPAAAPAASSAAPATVGSGGDWFAIANKWRVAGGQAAFVQDATLVKNAQKTADDSVGGLNHELNPGTFAQVLAPGDASNFESVYVGGWLCELPNNPGLNGICSSASQGWNHDGQTGHAEILTGSYKKIGCALSSSTGVWSCDLA